jgi:hypothetical protein
MKLRLLKLGTIVKDKGSQTEGMLINTIITGDGHTEYVHQPRGLSEDTGEPVKYLIIDSSRIEGAVEEEMDIPMHILGTEVEDLASGYKGMAINIILHLNGCVHIGVKAPGILPSGKTIDSQELDLRRLKGAAITPMSEEQKRESQKTKPSPTGGRVTSMRH